MRDLQILTAMVASGALLSTGALSQSTSTTVKTGTGSEHRPMPNAISTRPEPILISQIFGEVPVRKPARMSFLPTPTAADWINTDLSIGGHFAYLSQSAVAIIPSVGSGVGLFTNAQTKGTGGAANTISIGHASLGYLDSVGGAGSWAYYGVGVRGNYPFQGAGSATGATQVFEGDVTNLGPEGPAAVPGSPYPDGRTNVATFSCGGELAQASVRKQLAPCTAGLIISTNSDKAVPPGFLSGIVFDQRGLVRKSDPLTISGGPTATGIAFGSAHFQRWYYGVGANEHIVAQAGGVGKGGTAGAYEITVVNSQGGAAAVSLGGLLENAFVPSAPIANGSSTYPWYSTTTQRLNVALSNPPASSKAPCVQGDITYSTSFVFICVATNTWRRSALSAF